MSSNVITCTLWSTVSLYACTVQSSARGGKKKSAFRPDLIFSRPTHVYSHFSSQRIYCPPPFLPSFTWGVSGRRGRVSRTSSFFPTGVTAESTKFGMFNDQATFHREIGFTKAVANGTSFTTSDGVARQAIVTNFRSVDNTTALHKTETIKMLTLRPSKGRHGSPRHDESFLLSATRTSPRKCSQWKTSAYTGDHNVMILSLSRVGRLYEQKTLLCMLAFIYSIPTVPKDERREGCTWFVSIFC